MFGGLDGLEPDKGDLHAQDGADAVHDRVSNVDFVVEPSANHKGEHVHRDQIDQENITSPGGDLI